MWSQAGGLVKFMAQIGGASAGAPFGQFVDRYGWEAGLQLLCVLAVVAGLAMAPLLGQTARAEDASEPVLARKKLR